MLYFRYKDLIIGKYDSMLKLVSIVLKFLVKVKFFVRISGIGIKAIFEWN